MASQKTAVTPFWNTILVASIFFSLSAAFPSELSTEPEEVSSSPWPLPSNPAPSAYPPQLSPPSRWQQPSPVPAQPAMPPSSMSPMPYPMPPSLPAMPSSMPPYPSKMPYPMPPSLPPMPPSMPPYPSKKSYPMPPSPPPMPSSMPPYPSQMPYPMPPSPPPLPSSMPPYPSQMPYPMPPSPPPMPSSMPPSPSMPDPGVPLPAMPSPIASPPSTPISPPPPVAPTMGIKGGYWLSSSAEKYPPSIIPTRYFTHLFYAFLPLDASTYQLSISQPDDHWMANFTATLHAQSPPLKAFLAIGGGLAIPDTFSKMANSSVNRATFVKSTIEVARKYGFDGLDLDWEFPSTPQDMSNLALLFKEWRESVENESKLYGKPRLLISAAVYFSPDFFLSSVPRTYPTAAIRSYVDFVNTLNFDYHGSWDTSATAEHAVLADNSSRICTYYGMDAWTFDGVPPDMIVMGLPLYGRTWKLKDPNKPGIGAPAVGVGPGDKGVMFYKDIVDFNLANGATVVIDNDSVSTYSYKGTDWIGYDGPTSVSKKIEYAREFGGYFFWALGYDKNWTLSELASTIWDS